MALSDDRLAAIGREHGFGTTITDAGYHCDTLWFDANPLPLMRAIEAEVRGQDEALIRQLVVALEAMRSEAAARHCGLRICDEAITAARARLDGKP